MEAKHCLYKIDREHIFNRFLDYAFVVVMLNHYTQTSVKAPYVKQPLENEEVIHFITKVKTKTRKRTEPWNLIHKYTLRIEKE